MIHQNTVRDIEEQKEQEREKECRPGDRGRKVLKHGGGERRVDGLNVLTRRTSSDLDDAIKLVHSTRSFLSPSHRR